MESLKAVQTSQPERYLWSTLLLVASPVLQLGGWGAAFTDIGAVFVLAGTAGSLVGFLLRPRFLTLGAATAGVLIGGWGWFIAFVAF
jgi:hypothetical protein